MSERRSGTDDRRARHKIHHVAAIPDRGLHPVKYRLLQARWRIALWSVVYPVQIALVLSLVVCSVPMWMVLKQQATLRHQQATQQHQQRSIQANRVAVVKDICAQLDRNARTSNAQLKLFQGIIVNGATQSRPFEHVYRQLGLPPYRVRLKQAERTAQKIGHLKLPLPNCTTAVYKVQTEHPPNPPRPGPPH